MQYDRSKEIKVGLVTFAALLLFIVGMTLGKGYRISVDPTKLSIEFPNSGGIDPSSPVMINGVERGSVSTIKPNNGNVLITVTLDDISDLQSDASARISMREITGGKKIDIFPGSSDEKLDPNKTLPGRTSPDLGELISVTGDLIIDRGIPLFLKIDSILNKFSDVIERDSVLQKITYSVNNTYEITESTKKILSDNEHNISKTLANLRDISDDLKHEIKDKTPALDTLFAEMDKAMKQANTLLVNADSSRIKLDIMLGNLNLLLEDVRQGDGLVSRLLYDKEFNKELDSTLNTIKLLMEQIKEHGINTNVRLGGRP
jgi:phospholipid/cholesterol/gamma-HCH transport system substrate-binding protein